MFTIWVKTRNHWLVQLVWVSSDHRWAPRHSGAAWWCRLHEYIMFHRYIVTFGILGDHMRLCCPALEFWQAPWGFYPSTSQQEICAAFSTNLHCPTTDHSITTDVTGSLMFTMVSLDSFTSVPLTRCEPALIWKEKLSHLSLLCKWTDWSLWSFTAMIKCPPQYVSSVVTKC